MAAAGCGADIARIHGSRLGHGPDGLGIGSKQAHIPPALVFIAVTGIQYFIILPSFGQVHGRSPPKIKIASSPRYQGQQEVRAIEESGEERIRHHSVDLLKLAQHREADGQQHEQKEQRKHAP